MAAPVSVQLPETVEAKVRQIATEEHRSLAETIELLAVEALKAREFPGVYFMAGPTGRRARLHGGPDVWEVIEPYLHNGKDWQILRECYPHVAEQVLQTALRYYEAYPAEIGARIAQNNHACLRQPLPNCPSSRIHPAHLVPRRLHPRALSATPPLHHPPHRPHLAKTPTTNYPYPTSPT